MHTPADHRRYSAAVNNANLAIIAALYPLTVVLAAAGLAL